MDTGEEACGEPPSSEADLFEYMRAARAQARNDFDAEYALAVPAIVAWSRLRISARTGSGLELDDLVQETWARALESHPRFDPSRSNFRTWVIGIAQFVLLEALRRNARQRNTRELHGESGGLSHCPDSITSITRVVARNEGMAHLLRLVDSLPTEDRDLVLLRGLEDRPLAEVAARLGVNEDTAGKRWQRLCERLRELPAFRAVLGD